MPMQTMAVVLAGEEVVVEDDAMVNKGGTGSN